MSFHAAIQIDWFGDFTLRQARDFIRARRLERGLYVCIDKRRRKRVLSYIGISDRGSLLKRVTRSHPQVQRIGEQHLELWIGEIGSHAIRYGKDRSRDRAIEIAEWLHIVFLKECSEQQALQHNQSKAKGKPDVGTVLNHWWHVEQSDTPRHDTDRPFRNLDEAPHEWWPYVIDYYGSGYTFSSTDIGRECRLTWMDGSFAFV